MRSLKRIANTFFDIHNQYIICIDLLDGYKKIATFTINDNKKILRER